MKKLGLLVIALVVALGCLGAGYAMWSDSLIIKGSVSTGSVDINISSYSATYVWKTSTGSMLVTGSSSVPAGAIDAFPNDGDSDTDPVAFATASQTMVGGSPVDDAVTFTFRNLFPLELSGTVPGAEGYCASFSGTYDGTVPIHIATRWSILPKDGVVPTWASELMSYHASIQMLVNGVAVNETNWSTIQLHEKDVYTVRVCIDVPQTLRNGANSQTTMSGRYFDLIARIVAYQWNEPAPTVDLP